MSELERYFYQQEQACPVCGGKFGATKVRKSMCAVERRDADLYNYCTPVDPNLYSVWVCPHCGYAASDATFAEVKPAEKPMLQKALAERQKPPDLTGERDAASARLAMEQAIFCAQARNAKPSALAGLYLKTAWVLRFAGDPEEQRYLEEALANYKQAYQSEALPLGKMSELTLVYLIGELSRRAGNLNEAVNWFYQVANSPDAAREPQILNMAKEQWQVAREQAEKASSEAPAGSAPAAEPTASSPSPSTAAASAATPTDTAPAAPVSAPPVAPAAPAAPATADAASAAPTTEQAAEQAAEQAPHPKAEAPDSPPGLPVSRAKVPTALSLYRDQVDWARRVANLCAGQNPRLDVAAVVRASLRLVESLDPTELEAGSEEALADRLRAALSRS